MINTVLFDLDGTLADSAVPATTALNHVLISAGYAPVSVADVRPLFNAGATALFREFADVNPADREFGALRESLFDHYSIACQRPLVFRGVVDSMCALAAHGIRWGIVTNERSQLATSIVANINWGPFPPEVLICGDTLATCKPEPDVLLEAASRLDVLPTDCVYVGDSETDVAAGRAAGMTTVLARYGYLPHNVDGSDWGADAMIEDPGELIAALGPCFEGLPRHD